MYFFFIIKNLHPHLTLPHPPLQTRWQAEASPTKSTIPPKAERQEVPTGQGMLVSSLQSPPAGRKEREQLP